MKKKSRRQFLGSVGGAAAGVFAARAIPAWSWKAPSEPATSQATSQLSLFRYSDVQLLDGPFRAQFEQNHRFFLDLNEDGLLKPFRQRQGLPAPGPDMGGWYDNADDFNEKDNFCLLYTSRCV